MSISLSSNPTFTRLNACITEEENVFTLTVRLFEHRNGEGAGGEEIAPSIHSASLMIDAIAERFGISQKHISIIIVMENFKDGTFH